MKPPRSHLLSVYKAATRAAEPARPLMLQRRLKAGKEHRLRLGERAGEASVARPEGGLFWLHGASVGEFLSILPLASALAGTSFGVLVTTGTLTSADLAAERLPAGAVHQMAPFDFPKAVKRFYDHWRPDMAIFAESEIWPNLMKEALDQAIPLAIVNGRMSARSFGRWRSLRSLAEPLLGRLDLCLTQSEEDAVRFRAIGATRALSVGNLKFDAEPLPCSPEDLGDMQSILGDRPVWLAASTHAGEEDIVLAAHRRLASRSDRPLTIIIPRHPERGGEIAALAARHGFQVRQRSRGERPDAESEVYVADSLGELGLFFRLSRIAFIGGSLVAPGGGHNPIEAALLGSAILHGPHTRNFASLYASLTAANAAIGVTDGDTLAGAIESLLGDTQETDALAERARREVEAHKGALARTLEHLAPYQASILARAGERQG
ncbi:MAG: 3-deoxy-D-manno-octulosonic acid transferase [Beijerinckiaceae bacterium]|nr:3-deoxy-D-manno-octulosonic acid transferase [Beijerinckiaceae bacterium]